MPLDSVLNAIGKTPCVQIHNLSEKHIHLYAKLDFLNPGLSSQDRVALAHIEAMEHDHSLKPHSTLIAVANAQWNRSLAMVCAQKNYRLVLLTATPPEANEIKLLRILGADFLPWPASERHLSEHDYAIATATKEGWYFLERDKPTHPNPGFYDSTAYELFNSFSEKTIDFLFLPLNENAQTQYLVQQVHRYSPTTKIILCHLHEDLTNSAFNQLDENQVQQCFAQERETLLQIPTHAAKWGCVMAAQQEGILTGIYGGAALAAAVALAQRLTNEQTLVCLFPDRIEAYLHHENFDISANGLGLPEVHIATGDEVKQSQQLAIKLPVMEVEENEPLITDVTEQMLKQFINNPDNPVVMFGLERCEFCWATRKLFKLLDVPVHCVDLDSAAYLPCQLGEKIRATLIEHTDCHSLPQVFVRGEFIGGSLEVFDMANNASLQRKLDQHRVPHNRVLNIDPYVLLPGWMHDHSM